MSYQERAQYGPVVVCDCCGTFGAIGDRDWRQMRGSGADDAVHLCPGCRRRAVWCEVHQQYHLPESLHRRACVTCGGLFTARVELGLEHCPACRRELGVVLPPVTPPPVRRTTGLRLLMSHLPWHASRRHH
ncbi:MAG: hypothetical protein HXY39_07250 [Chloroflexi bacterium]|nr:hypothetical protein [Chloroflexota bacterium]